MTHQLLQKLYTQEFRDSLGYAASADQVRRQLLRTQEVQSVRSAVATGQLADTQIRAFVDELVSEFRRGAELNGQMALAALVAALERIYTPYADELLTKLSALQAPEMRTACSVARECMKHRSATQVERKFYEVTSPITDVNVDTVLRDYAAMPARTRSPDVTRLEWREAS